LTYRRERNEVSDLKKYSSSSSRKGTLFKGKERFPGLKGDKKEISRLLQKRKEVPNLWWSFRSIYGG
jgi:hypothetical protein